MKPPGQIVRFRPSAVAELSAAIFALCRDDALVTPLSGVLFDAENLDKLGHLVRACAVCGERHAVRFCRPRLA